MSNQMERDKIPMTDEIHKMRKMTIEDHETIAKALKVARNKIMTAQNIIKNQPLSNEWLRLCDADHLLALSQVDMLDSAWANDQGQEVNAVYGIHTP